MKMKFLAGMLLLLSAGSVLAADPPPLAGTTILIIRHAEKPETGDSLTADGEKRAAAYVDYFKNFTVDSQPLKLTHIFAATDSKGSRRPRLTVTPLSVAIGLPIDQRFTSKQAKELADELRAKSYGHEILICWHHGQIPELLQALGAKPDELFPNGKWPDQVFGWVIELSYDDKGQLIGAKKIPEMLMPDDTAGKADKD